jgi:non-specific serine/threonine protein kinase
VTLLGFGGLGKTRLSLQVAAEVVDQYRDGVWLVELAPLTDSELVPQAVASVLGVKEEPGHPVLEALVEYSRNKRFLLVLDNCEHVIQACAELVSALLEAGPGCKIIASSREPLRISGEVSYYVPSLSVPRIDHQRTPEAFMTYEAVRLFVDRAAAAQPAFRVTEQNTGAIAQICNRLDGIPLALELAAARIRALPVETIAERLSDRFRLLTGGSRTALPRQQTLRALIDWSYDLLSHHERMLLRRLAVFAGGWTLEAAEAVCAGGEIDEAMVLDLLTQLVEKSLVVLSPEGGRYRLLDTVRQYAQERLVKSDESDATRAKHLGFYLDLVERARPELKGPQQAAALSRIDADRENLLVAHAWCEQADAGAEAGLRLAYAVKPYWLNRGLLGLGYRFTNEALARADAQARTVARCGGLADAGQLGFFLGRYAEAQALLEESLAIAREMEDSRRIAAVLQPLGMACLGQGHVAAARGHLEDALRLARDLGNERELAAALNALAQLHRMDGNLDSAESLYDEAVTLARKIGDGEIVAIGLLNLAMVSVGRNSGLRARAMLIEVLNIADAIGSKPAVQSVLEVSAGLAMSRTEWAAAALFYGMAEALAAQTGLQRDPADEAFLAPRMAKVHEMLGADAFAKATAPGVAVDYDSAVTRVRTWLEDLS